MAISTGDPKLDALLRPRRGDVQFIDVGPFNYLMLDGHGAPGGPDFTAAIQALYAVSYAAHFAVKKALGAAPRVMPLEALWWVTDAESQELLQSVAAGTSSMSESDRDRWRWRAMILQLPPLHRAMIDTAIEAVTAKGEPATRAALRWSNWAEGNCAQLLHVGPYSAESASIALLHKAISDHGYRPRGHHHEIYLGDPRRADPARLRTILRQPVEPVEPVEP